MRLRTSAKAALVHEGRVLLSRCRDRRGDYPPVSLRRTDRSITPRLPSGDASFDAVLIERFAIAGRVYSGGTVRVPKARPLQARLTLPWRACMFGFSTLSSRSSVSLACLYLVHAAQPGAD